MNLSGIRVLVDGFNLELAQGTGIKTYGISLVQALLKLGAEVDVLYSRDVGRTKDSLLEEIVFFDTVPTDPYEGRLGRVRKYADALNILYRTLARRPYQAQAIATSDRVVKQPVQGSFVSSLADIIDDTGIYNLRNCYKQANAIFKALKRGIYVDMGAPVDVFHATYPLPVQVKGVPKITTIHDLIPLRLPYTTLDRKPFYYELIRQTLNESAAIATVSEHSKKDILDLFDVNPDKIHVTYQPIALKPLEEDREMIRRMLRKFGLTDQGYVLFVGAIEPKKNVGRLIDAYLGLDTDLPLVLVGKLGWLWEDEVGQVLQEASQATSNVRFLRYVNATDLRYLFSGAACFAFPSLYEGFGLPVLEAMSFGCPVLTSNTSSLPEIGGDAALYADPFDVKQIRSQLGRILSDAELRQQMAEKGRQQAERFSFEHYLKRLGGVYAQVL